MGRSKYKSINGIVLKRFPLGESDQIYTVYTAEYGLIRATARGALKPRNKWRGVLEPFHQIEAEIIMSARNTLHKFINAEVISRPSGFLEHLTALNTAYVVLECLGRFTADESCHPDLYSEGLKTLGMINSNPDFAGFIVRCFCLRFFTLSGFGVEWNQCTMCKRERPDGRSAYCIPAEGGIICSSCLSKLNDKQNFIMHGSTIGFAIQAAAGNTTQNMLENNEVIECFNNEIRRVIREMFAHHLGEIPISLQMMI